EAGPVSLAPGDVMELAAEPAELESAGPTEVGEAPASAQEADTVPPDAPQAAAAPPAELGDLTASSDTDVALAASPQREAQAPDWAAAIGPAGESGVTAAADPSPDQTLVEPPESGVVEELAAQHRAI